MTDDELILFDAIAIHPGVPRFFLGKEDYPLHLNCEYTHSLSDDELENRLREMERRGWLKSYSDPDFTPWPDLSGPELENWPRLSRRHDLTPTGMELWEAERNPVWERYAFDLGSFWEEGADNFFEVHCVNPEIGRECALVSRECGLVDFDLDTLVYLPESGFESPKGQSMHLWRANRKNKKKIRAQNATEKCGLSMMKRERGGGLWMNSRNFQSRTDGTREFLERFLGL